MLGNIKSKKRLTNEECLKAVHNMYDRVCLKLEPSFTLSERNHIKNALRK